MCVDWFRLDDGDRDPVELVGEVVAPHNAPGEWRSVRLPAAAFEMLRRDGATRVIAPGRHSRLWQFRGRRRWYSVLLQQPLGQDVRVAVLTPATSSG